MKKLVASAVVASFACLVFACKEEPAPAGNPPAKPTGAVSSNAVTKPAVALSASGSAVASAAASVAASASTSASTVATAPLPPAGCVEPKSLKAHPVSELASITGADPVDPDPQWSSPDDTTHEVSANGVTYHIEDADAVMGIVDAKKGGAALFHIAGESHAGGAVDVALSPKGTLLASAYSRGDVTFYDASTGKRIDEAGMNQYALSPDESYVVIAPVRGAFTGDYSTTDLVVLSLGAKSTKKVVASWKSIVKVDDPPYDSGVAICPTGAVFAASHPKGELAIYRASDLAKVASLPTPPKGQPSFTRSGKWLVIAGVDGTNAGLYELVP